MKAAVLTEIGKPFVVEDVEEPHIRADEVLIETRSCGICRTDLHIQDGFAYVPHLPHVPGHEPAGIVVDVGRDVEAIAVGQRVVPHLFVNNGDCRYTRTGQHAQARLKTVVHPKATRQRHRFGVRDHAKAQCKADLRGDKKKKLRPPPDSRPVIWAYPAVFKNFDAANAQGVTSPGRLQDASGRKASFEFLYLPRPPYSTAGKLRAELRGADREWVTFARRGKLAWKVRCLGARKTLRAGIDTAHARL